MRTDLDKEPTLDQMKEDYERHCTRKVWDGITYYVHNPNCECWNCEKTRQKYSIDLPRVFIVPTSKVTVHQWNRDKHGYQEFGRFLSENEAVKKAAYYAELIGWHP